jgi:hypothetical protein
LTDSSPEVGTEKATSLFMPISVKRRADKDAPADSAEAGAVGASSGTFSMFMLRPNWFSLKQPEGDEFAAESITPAWDAVTAMAALDIIEGPSGPCGSTKTSA